MSSAFLRSLPNWSADCTLAYLLASLARMPPAPYAVCRLRGTVRRRGTNAPLRANITGVLAVLPVPACFLLWFAVAQMPAAACLPPQPAALHLRLHSAVAGRSTVTRSGNRFGDFYRPLAPSRTPYRVKVEVAGKRPRYFNVAIPADGSGATLAVTFP